MSRKKKSAALVAIVAIAALVVFHAPILRAVAAFLIVEDPLRKAAAIVALGGQTPFRQIEAAKLYHGGWAPLVFVVQEGPSDESEALRELGIKIVPEWELSRQVLLKQGVPASAIIVPQGKSSGTLEELQAAYKALISQRSEVRDRRSDVSDQKSEIGDQGAADAPVILVTSKYHTRRTKLTWDYVTAGRSQAIVRAAARDPFDPSRWWQQRRFILAVVREYLGLANYYAGFPVAP